MAWKVIKNDFPGMAQRLAQGVESCTEAAAVELAALAGQSAPVRSGKLAASIYAQTQSRDGYDDAAAAVARAAKPSETDMFEDSGISTDILFPRAAALMGTSGRATARVLVGVTYGVYVHKGFFWKRPGSTAGKTLGKWIPGRPFLTVTSKNYRDTYYSNLAAVLKSLENGGSAKTPRAKRVRQVSEEQWRRRLDRTANAAVRQSKKDEVEFIRNRLPASAFQRQAYGLNTKTSGARTRETYGEVWERVRRDAEALKDAFVGSSDSW